MNIRNKIITLSNSMECLQFSQFTIDWIQELGDDRAENEKEDNGYLEYQINTICEVLKDGKDKMLFDMLSIYIQLLRREGK